MNFYFSVIDLLICIVESAIYYDFFRNIMPYRIDKRLHRMLIISGMTGAIWLVNSAHNSLMNLVIVFAITIVANFILYEGKLAKRILYIMLMELITLGTEFATEAMMILVFGKEAFSMCYEGTNWLYIALVVKIFVFVILRMIKPFISDSRQYIDRRMFKWMYILPVTSFFIYIGFAYNNLNQGEYAVIRTIFALGCFMLLICNILFFYLYERVSEIMYQNSEMKFETMKNQMESSHYERIDEMNQEYSRIIHDMRHYLNTIGSLAKQGKDTEITELLEEIQGEVKTVVQKVYCTHPVLNALLCEKESVALQQNIRYEICIDPSVDLSGISNYDMIGMVGNLLDNALEAAGKCQKERYVRLELYLASGSHFIMCIVTNGVETPLIPQKKHFHTTKSDAGHHGIGLTSVEELAAKNGGFLSINTDKNRFEAVLLLAIRQES
ncbi:MAG: GHKL domain-containing protein [bacterium]|nr:GHKL domain-containing protein [bacterium]